MNKVKILHCSDLHFDTPFSDLPGDIAEQRKEELQETFSKIVELARNEKVDVMLLSGDIFDNLRVRKTTLDFLRKKLASISNIEVFISPGNHDPNNGRSFYNMIKWPANVHIFGGQFTCYELRNKSTVVYGAGFTNNYVQESLLKDFNIEKGHENLIKLMVLHGEISNGSTLNEYNPINVDEIKNSLMDYIALGHRHQFSEIKRSGNTLYAYCGCPEGRGFDELGDKGVILGEIGSGYNSLKFIPLSKRTYNLRSVNISGCTNYEDIKERVLKSLYKEELAKNLYKVILTGEISEEFNIDLETIYQKLREYFYFIKIEDNTKIKINLGEITEEHSIKGIFAKKIIDKMSDCNEEEKTIYELALKLGIQSLSEGEIKLNEN